jgi:hypothetical protein
VVVGGARGTRKFCVSRATSEKLKEAPYFILFYFNFIYLIFFFLGEVERGRSERERERETFLVGRLSLGRTSTPVTRKRDFSDVFLAPKQRGFDFWVGSFSDFELRLMGTKFLGRKSLRKPYGYGIIS